MRFVAHSPDVALPLRYPLANPVVACRGQQRLFGAVVEVLESGHSDGASGAGDALGHDAMVRVCNDGVHVTAAHGSKG